MSLRDFLRWWLRGLRATAVAVDEALTQRRQRREQDLASFWAEYEAETERRYAAWKAEEDGAEPLASRYLSIEELLSLPIVTPDRTRYDRPDCDCLNEVMVWMVYQRSSAWWETPSHEVRDAAVYWLAMRERVTGVRLS